MSEVREITKAEKPPLHSNHLLVERTRQGTVVVSGTGRSFQLHEIAEGSLSASSKKAACQKGSQASWASQ